MRIAVTGAGGLIGSNLVPALRAVGHQVVRLVRSTPSAPDEVGWNPSTRDVDLAGLAGTDAVVHLAGAPLAGERWTARYRQLIRASRVDGTLTIAEACARLDPPPSVLVSGSAVGWYGDSGDAVVDESAPAGRGFLADVVRDWEAATAPAENAGIRVVRARTGVVIAAGGGLLSDRVVLPGGVRVSLLALFRAGLGGRLGSGRQWMSWISLADEVASLQFLLDRDDVRGPVNLTAPHPVRNREFTAALGRALHRPALLPVPAFALRAATGDFAEEALGSQRALPRRLEGAGYRFRVATIDEALRAALAG
jgi:uncharacterized protein (TIGR01777 family)